MTDGFGGKLTRRDAVAVLLAMMAAPAAAAVNPAEGYVSKIADDVMALANSGQRGDPLKSKFAALLARYINLRGIANFALGPYQNRIPAAKKDEFYKLVNNYSAALFVYYVDDFKGSQLEIVSTTKQGAFTTIMSNIRSKAGGREGVRWRLTGADGGYRVSDVNLKGIWLTISMKKLFGDTLKRSKGDFGPLFEKLREAETW
jgi:phospholipid transport system substrate-binding protein